MSLQKNGLGIPTVALASALGGNIDGSREAPFFLKQHLPFLDWWEIITPKEGGEDKCTQLSLLNQQLSDATERMARQNPFFLSFGGDHSNAIGTWAGVGRAYPGDLGLIWFDAHMDAHTPETSPSGNIHGMPLAVLMGHGDSRLTKWISPYYKPENVALIGIRSFEEGEAQLLERLGVRIFFMEEIQQKGLKRVLEEAQQVVLRRTAGYGISFDLDCVDPSCFASVSTPVPGGIDAEELLSHLPLFQTTPLVGLEVVEYNPGLDKDLTCLRFIQRLIERLTPLLKHS